MGNVVKLLSFGVGFGVGIVNAVNHCRLEDDISLDFGSSQGSGGVGAEIGVAGTAAENNYSALFHVADSLVSDIGLGDLRHGNSGLNSYGHAELLKSVANAESVDSRGEHSHMIGAGSVHLAGASASPEVAAADNDADLNALLVALLDRFADAEHRVKIYAVLVLARERFARELQ